MKNNRYYAMSEEELLTRFKSSRDGLDIKEVTRRTSGKSQ